MNDLRSNAIEMVFRGEFSEAPEGARDRSCACSCNDKDSYANDQSTGQNS